jgi:DNA-binding MarR family transcriptional regulator
MADTLALHFIAHGGSVTPSDVGSFTGLTSGAVTTMLDRLETAGHIRRKRSAQDRRVVLVSLRPGTQQTLAGFMMAAHEEVGKIFSDWSVADVEALVRLLERLPWEP